MVLIGIDGSAVRRGLSVLAVAAVATASAAGASGGSAAQPGGTVAFVRFTVRAGHPRIFTIGLAGGRARMLRLPVTAAEAPAWSRDGRRLALVGGTNSPGTTDITAGAQLYVANADGSAARLVTRDRARKGAVAWSGDGRELVFVRSVGSGGSSLWVIGADGRRARRLTYGATDLEPSWSADGRSIVFLRVSKTFESEVMVVRPDGSGLHRILTAFRNASDPVWSPDGKRLLVEDGHALFTVGLDGRGRRMIARLTADSKGALEDPQPSWSADGRWVVFCQWRAHAIGRSDLWLVGSDGKGLRRLTISPGLDTDPSIG